MNVKFLWVKCILSTLCWSTVLGVLTVDETVRSRQGDTTFLPCHFDVIEHQLIPNVVQWLRVEEGFPIVMKIWNRPLQVIDASLRGRVEISKKVAFSASMTIHNVSGDDTGTYQCNVSFLHSNNTNKADFMKIIRLYVSVPPTFQETPPSTIEGNLGRALLLRCLAIGEPKPVMTWMKDGYDVKNGQRGVVIINGELSITSLQRHHAGRYVCRAHSAAGTKQHSTIVYVLGPPQFRQKPQDGRAREGQTIIFNCNAQGYPSGVEYRWLHNGLVVTELGRRYNVQRDGSLIIRSVAIRDKGQVTCEASNGYGSPSRASAALTVEYAARVVGMPEVVYGGVTRSVKILCPTLAEPPVNGVDWIKDGRKIYPVQSERYTTDENISLMIHSVTEEDAGIYTCTPRNSVGSRGSGSSRLQIKKLPQFKTQPSPYYEVIVGARFSAPCVGMGDVPPSISWRKIGGSGQDMVYCVDQGSLSISSVRKEHHGVWQCVLSGQVGDVTSSTKIVVKNTTPHQAENLTAAAVDESSIRIKWTSGYDGGFPQTIVVWYKRKGKGNHTWKKHYVENKLNSVIVEELQPNTTYQLAVVGQNEVGVGKFSDIIMIQTRALLIPTTPPPLVQIARPENVSHVINKYGLVTMSWIPHCCDADLLGYIIEFTKLGRAPNLEDDALVGLTSENIKSRLPRRIVKRSFSEHDDITNQNKESKIWNKFGATSSNTTSYVIKNDQLYRNQLYQFRVLAATSDRYSEPSSPYTISTEGLTAYPLYVEPDLSSSPGLNDPAVIGILVGVVLFCLFLLVIGMLLYWTRVKKGRVTEMVYEDCNGDAALPTSENEIKKLSVTSCVKAENEGMTSSLPAATRLCRESSDGRLRYDSYDYPPNEEECDSDNDEEKQRLLDQLPACNDDVDLQTQPFRDRRHSISEESLRVRRETALRVLCAQNAHRFNTNMGARHIDMIPKRCASTTPTEQTCWQQSYANSFDFQPCMGATSRPVILEDRRLLGATDEHNDSVFAVVGEDKKKSVSFAIPSTASCINQMINPSLIHPTCLSSRPSDFSLDTNVAISNTFEPCRNRTRKKHIGSSQQSHPRCRRPSYDHNQALTSFAQSSADKYFPTERQVMKKHAKDPTFCPQSFHFRNDDRLKVSLSDQPSLEIDCSNSEIEVRLVNDRTQFDRRSSSTHSLKDVCKVGSDNMEQASQKIHFPAQSSSLKPCAPEEGCKLLNKRDCYRNANGVGSPSSSACVLAHTRRIGQEDGEECQTSSVGERKDHLQPSPTKRSHTNRKLVEWKRSRDLINSFAIESSIVDEKQMFNLESTGHYYNQHKAKSCYSLSEGDLMKRIAKPTVISLSQILCGETKELLDSLSPTSSFSPSPPNCHSKSAVFSNLPTCSVWGSLDRPLKLKQFSLPANEGTSINSSIFVENDVSLNTSLDAIYKCNGKKSFGAHSLLASPVKTSSWSSEEKNKLRYNSNPLSGSQHFHFHHQHPSPIEGNVILSPALMTSSPLSDVTSPDSLTRHHLGESSSSGYVTQDLSLRTSTSINPSNAERSRKDNSSVEDNYEWDSEFAAESEILEALKHFENLKSSTSMSETLQNKLKKFSRGRELSKTSLPPPNNTPAHRNEVMSSPSPVNESLTSYSKENMEKRCAQLREEFFKFQKQKDNKEMCH